MSKLVALVCVLAGCDKLFAVDRPVLDAPSFDAAPDGNGTGAWSLPVLLEGLPETTDDPSLTADLLEAYFEVSKEVFVATRTTVTEPFGQSRRDDRLTPVDEVSTPRVTGDGLDMYVQHKTGMVGMYHAHRESRDALWPVPTRVPELSITGSASATVTTDGRVMALTADGDLYLSERTGPSEAWSTPAPITMLNGSSSDEGTVISGDGLTLYFYSDRDGSDRLYVSHRESRDDAFLSSDLIVGLTDPQAFAEKDLWISPDEHHIVFVRLVGTNGATQLLLYATR